MKNKLGRQIMKEFVRLRAKQYSYLKRNNDVDIVKAHKKVCHRKKKLKFQTF